MTMNPPEIFGELRALAAGEHSRRAFSQMLKLIEDAEAIQPGIYDDAWREWLLSNLESWEARHRIITIRGEELVTELEWIVVNDTLELVASNIKSLKTRGWSELIQGVRLTSFDFGSKEKVAWLMDELLEGGSELKHISFKFPLIKKSQIKKFFAHESIATLKSLEFDDASFKVATFETLIQEIAQNEVLESLSFKYCKLTAKHMPVLCSSPLFSRLKSLDLTGNSSINGKAATAFAPYVTPECKFEEVSFAYCEVGSTGGKALAEANWPTSLGRLDVFRNGLGLRGMNAMLEHGMLKHMITVDGVLDLSLQYIKDKQIRALFLSEEFAQVRRLDLTWSMIEKPDKTFKNLPEFPNLEFIKLPVDTTQSYKEFLHFLQKLPALKEVRLKFRGESEDIVTDIFALPQASQWTTIGLLAERFDLKEQSFQAIKAWDGWDRGGQIDAVLHLSKDGDACAHATDLPYMAPSNTSALGQRFVLGRGQVDIL